MQSCTCNHGSTHPQTGCIFILRLSARPLLGLVGELDYSPINFTLTFWNGWRLPIIGGFKFYKVLRPTPWTFVKILRALICTSGFHRLFTSDVFKRKLQRCRRTCWLFLSDLAWLFRLISSFRSPLLLPGFCCSFNHDVLAVVSSIFSPVCSGYKVLGDTASLLWAISGEVFSLPSIIVVTWQRRYRGAVFRYLWQALLYSRLYYYYVEDDRIK